MRPDYANTAELLAAIKRLKAFIGRIQHEMETDETGERLLRLIRRARVAEKQLQDIEQTDRRGPRVMRGK